MDRKTIIRAIQFVAKPTAKLATTAVNKVTDLAIPETKEFIAVWKEAWDNDVSSSKPTIIYTLSLHDALLLKNQGMSGYVTSVQDHISMATVKNTNVGGKSWICLELS